MDELLKKKNKLAQKLKEHEVFESNTNKLKERLDDKIKILKEQITSEKQKVKLITKDIEYKESVVSSLKEKVEEYKILQTKQKRKELLSKYNFYIKKVNEIDFSVIEDFKLSFKNLNKALNKSKKYDILYKKLKELHDNRSYEIIQYLKNNIEINEKEIEKMHILSHFISLSIEFEDFFKTNFFQDFIFQRVYQGFEYHFLEERKTNRLDKPEWFLEYIIEKIIFEKKKIQLYSTMKKENVLYNFVLKINELVDIKINEYFKIKSSQKRSLLIHLANEIQKYQFEIKNKLGVDLRFNNLINFIIQEEKNLINEKMELIHLENYKKWFDEYKGMIRETFLIFVPLHELNKDLFIIIIQHVLDNIFIYNELFITQMRYINREEVQLLCLIFSELEILKKFVSEQEHEFILNLNIELNENNIDITKISKFNNDNLKLIKEISKSDIERSLKKLRNFIYISDKNVVNILIEIHNIVNEYKENLSECFFLVEKHLAELCDNYILNEIILKVQFDGEEYIRFNEFLRKIKDYFKTYKTWKSDTGSKCVKDIFEGRKPETENESLFNLIYKNYME